MSNESQDIETNTLKKKRAEALKYLGTKWVLHPKSTYDASLRRPGTASVLRHVVAKAIKAGRL